MNSTDINRKNPFYSKERKDILRKYYDDQISNEDEKKLHKLNLSMYSNYTNYSNELENFLFKSELDDKIILHPEQIECLEILNEGKDLLLSAPTSFGKTFLILEYMYRNKGDFKNILFIVPTIALRNELYTKIQKLFSDEYNIVINNFDKKETKNIYLMLPERMEEKEFIYDISKLDFDLCIIDEVYKLSEQNDDIRNIIFNKSYYIMLDNCRQLVLLGPFMKNVKFERKGKERKIVKYYSNYSPILNEPHLIEISNDNLINEMMNKINHHKNEKQIVFSPTPNKIQNLVSNFDTSQEVTNEYIEFLEEYYFKDWDLIKLLKNKITYHSGPIPKYLREYIENLYNDKESGYNVVIATSTLLEGINTPTNILHIYDIKYNKNRKLNKFELNNLIGRVGRLSEKVKGEIYIYDKSIYDMLEEEFAEEIIFTAETENYEDPEDGIDLEKEVKEEELENYEELRQEIIEHQKNTLEINVNMKYYRKFKENIEELEKNLKGKKTTFKKQLAILKYYVKTIQGISFEEYTYYSLNILLGKDFKFFLKNETIDSPNKIILNYFKALNFLEYEIGNLISLLQVDNLIDEKYEKEVKELIKIYGLFNDKTLVYKTLLDIGFANFDAEVLDEKLNNYEFKNSQKLIQKLLTLEGIENLSPFGYWKINQLKTSQNL